jgi:hypothetical protein
LLRTHCSKQGWRFGLVHGLGLSWSVNPLKVNHDTTCLIKQVNPSTLTRPASDPTRLTRLNVSVFFCTHPYLVKQPCIKTNKFVHQSIKKRIIFQPFLRLRPLLIFILFWSELSTYLESSEVNRLQLWTHEHVYVVVSFQKRMEIPKYKS